MITDWMRNGFDSPAGGLELCQSNRKRDMETTCTEEFEKALGKMLNECDAMGLIDSTAPILTDIARHWFELGFNAGSKAEREKE